MTGQHHSNSIATTPNRGRTITLCTLILVGLAATVLISNWIDRHRQTPVVASDQDELYLNGPTAKRLSLAFNGLAADWYWMRALQYVGRRSLAYQGTHEGQMSLNDLGVLDLRILPPLLRASTDLDPQFMAPYEYGAMILPTFNDEEAIALLSHGIEKNPDEWRLYQHLGYIYWQRHDYQKAGELYLAGAKLNSAPRWLAEMGARMSLEGGSREGARQMYQHLYDESNDDWVKQTLLRRLLQVDSFEQRDVIRRVLGDYSARFKRCPSSWKDISATLASLRLRIDVSTGAPLDPAGTPYLLGKNGCEVELDPRSQVPYR
jgi:tetratricopeptide (TPR) repeat protein